MSFYRRSFVPGGTYFFSVTLADRRSQLLVEQIDRLRAVYASVHQKYPFETVAICILPEHLHAIWTMPADDADYSKRWNLIKGNFSRGLPAAATRTTSKIRQREKGIWQRRFWEHQIRDEDDFQRHVDYVHFNPVKHGLVKQVADWEYSSFHQWLAHGTLNADWAGDASEGSFGE
jgi:putative transposase